MEIGVNIMAKNLVIIQDSLNDALGREHVISADNHLIDDGILDSLDSAVFLLNVETASGKKLPEDKVEELDLFNVKNMVAFLES